MRMLEQGPESQAASVICAGGVSAVISSSGLGALTFDDEDQCCKSKSATSALRPGPKAKAMQGPGVSRRRNRSRMNRIVADDMLP